MSLRQLKQIQPEIGYYITIIDTVWVYPMVDIERALAITLIPYTFDGTNLVCQTTDDLVAIYLEIYNQTTISNPGPPPPPQPNPGYSIGVQSFLQDFGKNLYFKLPDGTVFVQWRLVQLVTPQTKAPNNVIPTPGDSTPNVVGYVTIYTSFTRNSLPNSNMDPVNVARSG
jgi:hypothetical protein